MKKGIDAMNKSHNLAYVRSAVRRDLDRDLRPRRRRRWAIYKEPNTEADVYWTATLDGLKRRKGFSTLRIIETYLH